MLENCGSNNDKLIFPFFTLPRKMAKSKISTPGCLYSDIVDEDGREIILEWSEKRRFKLRNKGKVYYRDFLLYTFTFSTMKSFLHNFNFMVLIQMVIAVVAVYISKYFNLTFDVNVNLFVSPIVFPLAFSINTDFQRREKVLDDLANFKAAGMSWFFCMRDWRPVAQLDIFWMKAVHQKLKSMLFYMREYLLTDKSYRRKIILEAMYEDFSDVNQLIESVRTSKLPLNSALISRCQILLNSLCLAFERLRVIREYRSPRSIRAFNKVLIFFLPIILSPYFVLIGKQKKNEWSPYYISILVAFVFSSLQGVHDKLDNPFDGMSEDDINLSSIDDWTCQSLEAIANRAFTVGRFNVEPQRKLIDTDDLNALNIFTCAYEKSQHFEKIKSPTIKVLPKTPSFKRSNTFKKILRNHSLKDFERQPVKLHPNADFLERIKGDTKIRRGRQNIPTKQLVLIPSKNASLGSNPNTVISFV